MSLTEKNYAGDLVRYETDRDICRKIVTVVAAAALTVGTLLAKKTKSSVVTAKVAGGTGNGVIGACTLGAKAIPGVYVIKFTKTGGTVTTSVKDASDNTIGSFATTTASVADVISPNGEIIGELTVGTAFVSDHINLTVADGDADWTAGDSITVTVTGDNKYYPAESGAVDGTGEPCALLLEDLAISAGTLSAVLARDAVVAKSFIQWPSTYDTTNEKNAAYAALETNRIFCVDAI